MPASFSNALTVTLKVPPDEYVCEGVESDDAVSVLPSPQVIVYLVFAPAVGVVVIVKVTVSPALILVESATKETDFKYVPACTFPSTSFNSSIALVTFVLVVNPQ